MRALLAARRPAVLAGLQSALVGFDDEAEFVSTGTLQAAWALLRADRAFDMVLVAVDDSDLRTLGSVADARGEFPNVPLVVVSPAAAESTLPAAAVAAANGRPLAHETRDAPFLPTTHAALLSLGLTTRQAEVLALLLEGSSNKVIARSLGLSVDTVKDHVAAVMRNLGVNSRTQAVLTVTERLSWKGSRPLLRLPTARVGSVGSRVR